MDGTRRQCRRRRGDIGNHALKIGIDRFDPLGQLLDFGNAFRLAYGLLEILHLHFPLDLAFDFGDHAPRLSHPAAQRARQTRQALRSYHDQCYHEQ